MNTLEKLSDGAWSREFAAHLINRAGFGGSPGEVDNLYAMGLDRAVGYLLDCPNEESSFHYPAWDSGQLDGVEEVVSKKLEWHPGAMMAEDKDPSIRALRQGWVAYNRILLCDLRAWWLHRMRNTTHPLREKMTLFLHGHFATGFEKVKSARMLFDQNQLFRSMCFGDWRELTLAVARNPAMLVYLDGAQNTKKSPNENFAREVMELFTLGEGSYSEADIAQAARCFSGWKVDRFRGKAEFMRFRHDHGVKTVLGETGAFDDQDVLAVIFRQPQAARWLSEKLWSFFAYQNPEPVLLDVLAGVVVSSGFNIREVLQSLFSSNVFYSGRSFRTQVKSPVQWLVGMCRCLECPLPEAMACQNVLETLGQNLFQPPNVKGWEGGLTWMNSSAIGMRYKFSSSIAHGRSGAQSRIRMIERHEKVLNEVRAAGLDVEPVDFLTPWAREVSEPLFDEEIILSGTGGGVKKSVSALTTRLFQSDLRKQDRENFEAVLSTATRQGKGRKRWLGSILESMMNTPQFQLT